MFKCQTKVQCEKSEFLIKGEMDKMFKDMEDLIRSRNAQKEDELKKKFERKMKEDELYDWMAKLNIKDHKKMKRETQARISN